MASHALPSSTGCRAALAVAALALAGVRCDGAPGADVSGVEDIQRLGYPIIDHFSFDTETPSGSTRLRYSVLQHGQIPAYELRFLAQQCPGIGDPEAYLEAHWGALFEPENHKFVGRRFEIYDGVRNLGTVKHICERHEEVNRNRVVPAAEGACLRGDCLYIDNTENTLKNRGLGDPAQTGGAQDNIRFTTGSAFTVLAWVKFDYRRVDEVSGDSQLLFQTGELDADFRPVRNHLSFATAYDVDPGVVRLDLAVISGGAHNQPPYENTQTFRGVDTGAFILVAATLARHGERVEARLLVADGGGVRASEVYVVPVEVTEPFLHGADATTTFFTGLDNFCGWFDELTIVGQALDEEDVARFYRLYVD